MSKRLEKDWSREYKTSSMPFMIGLDDAGDLSARKTTAKQTTSHPSSTACNRNSTAPACTDLASALAFFFPSRLPPLDGMAVEGMLLSRLTSSQLEGRKHRT
jgi:hypothetical protein